jgi:hypothetical protein
MALGAELHCRALASTPAPWVTLRGVLLMKMGKGLPNVVGYRYTADHDLHRLKWYFECVSRISPLCEEIPLKNQKILTQAKMICIIAAFSNQ